jgi:hypothetical protein
MEATPKLKFKTREEWLNGAVEMLRPIIEAKERKLPLKVRVSTGWPSNGALATKKGRVLGQCWPPECSLDQTTEIFISPALGEVENTDGVLLTLLHELIHAAVGNECGHKGAFKDLAKALGFLPPMKTTPAGPELLEMAKEWAKDLGPYPHATLDFTKRAVKKQSTRMIKCECLAAEGEGTCKFKVRASRKVLVEIGIPFCPKHRVQLFADIPESEKDDGEAED